METVVTAPCFRWIGQHYCRDASGLHAPTVQRQARLDWRSCRGACGDPACTGFHWQQRGRRCTLYGGAVVKAPSPGAGRARGECWRRDSHSGACAAGRTSRLNVSEIPLLSARPLSTAFFRGLVQSDGLWLEFGVFRGNSINFIASRDRNHPVFGFDTFTGLPERWRRLEKGSFSLNGTLPEVRPNVRLAKGLFQDTLPSFLATHAGPVSLLHIDCDLYSSTAFVLQALGRRLVPGSVVVFDELVGYPSYARGEWKALRELVSSSRVSFEWVGRLEGRLPPSQAVALVILANPTSMPAG